jgi:hypothetical protein
VISYRYQIINLRRIPTINNNALHFVQGIVVGRMVLPGFKKEQLTRAYVRYSLNF